MKNNKNPIISIVTCTYNSEKYLKRALESIEKQTYQNIEHIINDSYSTDNTLVIIQKYIERNQDKYNIKFIQSEPMGVGNALNVATKEATGDLIHYLHSDDYYLNNESLEKVASGFVENPNLVWLTGNFLVEVSGKKISIPQTYLLRVNPEIAVSVMNIISHENTFMKREAVQMYGGFNESQNDVVEYGLWLNLIKDYKPLIVNDEFTVFIIHKGSKSTGSLIKFFKAVLRAFHTQRKEKVFPLIGYYADKGFYKQYKEIVKKAVKLETLLDMKRF